MKKLNFYIAGSIAIALLFTSCRKDNNNGQTIPPPAVIDTPRTAFKSLNFLYNISGKKTVAGQEANQYWKPMYDISGKYPGLWGEDLSFQPGGGAQSMDDSRDMLVSNAVQRWKEGALISVMFHSCPPTQPEPCDWNTGILSKLTNEQWDELITDNTPLNKNWKARLDQIAPYLLTLKDDGVEVLFRLFHEMNQGAFWWGGRPGENGTKKLYKISHDYLVKTKGLTNLIWVWSLQDFSTLNTDIDSYDPGDDYWDILTLDLYGSDGSGYTENKYNTLVKKAGKKPIGIGECDKLPTPEILLSQSRWTFFMGWAELTQEKNSNTEISVLYNSSNVITLDKMEGW